MEIAGTDNTQKEIAGNHNSGHMVGYFDSETGEMHRGSGLSELPDGVYVADEKYRLVRVTSYSQLLTLHDTVFKNSSPQSVRIRRIHKMVRDWFCENELDMSFPDERTHKAEANKAKKIRGSILNTNAGRLDPVKEEIRRLQKLEQKPNVTKEERIQQNYRLISACRSYLKKTAMPPTGESARKVGMVGDVLSYAMRENNLFAKELKLYRDPNNDHDRWAIMVCTTEGKELGYITRYKNETIARLMDIGKVFHAYVDELPDDDEDDEDDPRNDPTPTENFRVPFSVYMEE